MKTLNYILINGAFAFCLYFGFFEGVPGAANVANFYIGFLLVLTVIYLFAMDVVVASMVKANWRPAVPQWFDVGFDVLVVVALAYLGFFWLATGYVIHMVVVSMTHGRFKQAQAVAS